MSEDNNTFNTLWSKLPEKDLPEVKDWQRRVLSYDPSNVTSIVTLNPFNRHHTVSIRDLFPKVGNVCGCGCNAELTGRRTRWAADECENYALAVRNIIYGMSETIGKYLRRYYGWNCMQCGCEDKGHDMGANGSVSWIKIDHIIPVKLGGGACWLSNYQLLCHDCHVGKTNSDFNWKQKIKMPELF
jgi:5-methylcytosine-specific restriction endonuclease McrA